MDSTETSSLATDTSPIDPDEWVDKYSDKLYAYALQTTRDSALAEDLVQETFLAALGNVQQYQGRSQEGTWLFGILKHKIMDAFRKKARKLEDEVEDLEQTMDRVLFREDGNSWRVPPAKWNLNPYQALERQEFVAILEKCIEYLSKGVWQVYTLREIVGYSSQEVCDTLKIQPNNLWTRLHRARSSLRRCLEKYWFEME